MWRKAAERQKEKEKEKESPSSTKSKENKPWTCLEESKSEIFPVLCESQTGGARQLRAFRVLIPQATRRPVGESP